MILLLSERELVVCNATLLIHLSRAGLMSILKDLFGRVLVPRLVFEEVCDANKSPDSIIVTEAVQSGWLEVHDVGIDSIKRLAAISGTHSGETAAIVLAESVGALLIIDDKTGRRVAETLNVNCIGTVGVLLKAVTQRLMSPMEFRELIDRMVDQGFRLDTKVYRRVMKAAEDALR